MSRYSQQQRNNGQRRRHRRGPASAVATTVASAAVAYGAYRLAQWYRGDDDDENEFEAGIEHPLEEDLPSYRHPEERDSIGIETRNRNGGESVSSSNDRSPRGDSSSTDRNSSQSGGSTSWLSSTAMGVVGWFADAGLAALVGDGSAKTKRASKPTSRRQQLMRCRYQGRVAFAACFKTLQPILERLTDSSSQTKELKALRRRRQALKAVQDGGRQRAESRENGGSEIDADADADGNSDVEKIKEHERELRLLQEREEDLWREILVETTTRMMVTSYAYALLLLSLTVQFHWLASASGSSPDSEEEHQQQEREKEAMLMESHRYFLHEGLPLLVSTVRRSIQITLFGVEDDDDEENEKSVRESSMHWTNPSGQFVSSADIEQTLYRKLPHLLDDLRTVGGGRRRRRRNWIRFVLPDEEAFDPVWDICRSPFWEDAQEQVLNYVWYKVLRDGEGDGTGWAEVFRADRTNGTIDDFRSENEVRGNRKTKPRQQPRQPLAKVMAHFKKATSALFEEATETDDGGGSTNAFRDDARKTHVGRLQTLPTLLELGDVTFRD